MSKVNGSLGFTLRKEDHSALGHYVRALVREPALSDGRIQPGDRIVAVCVFKIIMLILEYFIYKNHYQEYLSLVVYLGFQNWTNFAKFALNKRKIIVLQLFFFKNTFRANPYKHERAK